MLLLFGMKYKRRATEGLVYLGRDWSWVHLGRAWTWVHLGCDWTWVHLDLLRNQVVSAAEELPLPPPSFLLCPQW